MCDGKVSLHVAEPGVETHEVCYVLVLLVANVVFDVCFASYLDVGSVLADAFFPLGAAAVEDMFDGELGQEALT